MLAPSTLEPVPVDLSRVFWAGIGAWTVALVVCGILRLTGSIGERAVPICVAGLLLGVLGLVWDRRRSRRARAAATAPPTA
ncbi:MAG: DUF2530 domain-containing protein [Cellulomonadaceae bacterium]|nr:DUF2530 domain-containing protein [Cellulomonadaceae bacterium]